jgi:uncharacterized membrane protein YfcA
MDHTVQILILTAAGFTGGFTGSQVGAGALFTLPALLYLGLDLPHSLAAQSLAGLLTNGIAAFEYGKKHLKRYKSIVVLAAAASLGSFLGSELLFIISPKVISRVFAAIFILLIIFLVADRGVASPSRIKPRSAVFSIFIAFVLGVYGGLVAVGVTTLAILFFSSLIKQHYIKAIASAVTIVTILQIPQVLVFIIGRRIEYSYALALIPGTIAGSILGSRLMLKNSIKYFKVLMVVVTLLVVAKLIISS